MFTCHVKYVKIFDQICFENDMLWIMPIMPNIIFSSLIYICIFCTPVMRKMLRYSTEANYVLGERFWRRPTLHYAYDFIIFIFHICLLLNLFFLLDLLLINNYWIKCFKPRGHVSSFFHSSFSPLSKTLRGALTLRGQLSNH